MHFLRIIKFISVSRREYEKSLQLYSQKKLIIKMSFLWKDNLSWNFTYIMTVRILFPGWTIEHKRRLSISISISFNLFKRPLIVTRTWAIWSAASANWKDSREWKEKFIHHFTLIHNNDTKQTNNFLWFDSTRGLFFFFR